MAARRNATAVADGRVVIADGSAEALPDGPFAAPTPPTRPSSGRTSTPRWTPWPPGYGPGVGVALAIQPRFGATDADARRLADENAERLAGAGFGDIRVETLVLCPTDVGCALGRLS